MTEKLHNKISRNMIFAQAWKGASRAVVLGVALLILGACQGIGGVLHTQGNGGVGIPGEPLADMNAAQRTLWAAGREAEGTHKYAIAANVFGRLYERRTNDPNVLAAFIRNMRYSGRAKEVLRYVDQNPKHLMSNTGVKFEYAKALLAAGRKKEALAKLLDVVRLMPRNWQVFSALGVTHDSMGQYGAAILAYRKALKLSPQNVVVLNNMAMSQAIAGKLSVAIATLKRAAMINRHNVNVRQNLALLYAVNGQINKARSLASMDLNAGDMETNLSFYRRFEGVRK